MTEINDVTTLTESVKRIAKAIDSESDTKSITDSLDAIADYIEENGIGGGGSDDFTTANVTVVYNYDDQGTDFHAPFVIEGFDAEEVPPAIVPRAECLPGETNFKVALYKGVCMFETGGKAVTSVSGNAELYDDVIVFVKGDCTITLGEDPNQLTD